MKSPSFKLLNSSRSLFVIKALIFLLLINCFTTLQAQPQQAFPTAYGAASYVTGGRGGTVYHVTNLNNSGSGSFRDAVSQSNRIVVFDVSGTIELTSNLTITADNLTIAGQSAPQGGITITGRPVYLSNVDNLILRYIRFRPDFTAADLVDALNANNLTNAIIDHCSISWAGDEAFSQTGNSDNITVQNCIFGESRTGMLSGDSNNPISTNHSIIGNLWYNISHRFPNVNALRTDVINNVVHNWFTRLKVVSSHDNTQLNEINNYFQSGVKTTQPLSPNWSINWLDIGSSSQRSNIRIYTDGNVYPGFLTEADNDWNLYRHRFSVYSGQYAGTSQWDPANTDFQLLSPLPLLGEAPNILSAEDALLSVPQNAGTNKYLNSDGTYGTYRDDIDTNYITHVVNNTSVTYAYPPTDIVNTAAYINFHNAVTSTPMNVRPANFDTDNDGMADLWETITFGNLSQTANGDADNNGYTNIEEYLNGVDETSTGNTNTLTLTSNVTNDEICFGDDVILTASGADSYVWSENSETGDNITLTPNTTTEYSVTGTFSDGSTSTEFITITVNPIPVANAGEDVEICEGESVTLTATGGSSYLWSTGQTTQSITVSPGNTFTYSVTVSENGCDSTPDDVVVTVNNTPAVDAGNDETINFGESVVLTATGADNYQWNTGETTQSITVSPSVQTTYSVVGTTGTCQDSDSVTVFIVGSAVVANAGEDQSICSGSSATLTATGGASYLWSTGETTASIEVSPSNTTNYTVTVFDATGTVSDTDDVIVTVFDLPNVDAGSDVTITEGESVTLTATGGASYLWSTGENTPSISVSPSTTTTYSVTGTSSEGCEAADDVIVTVQTETVIANAGDDVGICQGESTILTASGGATYLWSTGEDTASIEVSPNTTTVYSVTVFNTLGTDSDTDDVIVNVFDLPNVDAGSDVTITEGESITLTATGAASYLWSTGEDTASIVVSPNATTTYSVTGTSSEGCEAADDVIVTVQTETVIANAGDDVGICQGESTILTASGGTTYLWSTGEDTASIEVSPNNTTVYTVTVFNSLGTDSDTDDVIVNVFDLPNVDVGSDVTITEGESITLTATGAASYLWNTGEDTASIVVSPNATTTYSVTGTSNEGCEASDDITVTVETEVVIANAGDDVSICQGESIILTASGGTTYLWSTGEDTASIEVSPNSSTTYTVTAFNTLGTASDTDDVTVTVNALPNVDAGVDVTITEGESILLTASGASDYVWSTGETTESIEVSPLSTTEYSVTGFSIEGCNTSDSVLVTVDTESVNADAGQDVTICEGETTVLTASGGATYLWSTGETSPSIEVSPNATTTYTVTVFNTLQTASESDEVTVIVNAVPVADAGSDVEICEGSTITLEATGGSSFLWSTGETTQSIQVSPSTTTTYFVEVFNNDCSDFDEVTVVINEIPEADAGQDQEICEGTTITLVADGGTSYLWSTGDTTQTIEVSPSVTTSYTVEVFKNGCSSIDDVTVVVNETPSIDAGQDVIITEGESTTLTASGGETYEWSTGSNDESITVSPTQTTTYSVTGFLNGCQSTDQVTVIVEPITFVANAGEDQFICEGTEATLTASEGDAYLWSTGETTQSITVSPWATETYTVTVFEGDLQDDDEVTVFVNLNPNVVIMNGGEVDILEGEFITISATGANEYEWNNGATEPNIAVNPSVSTTYSVTGYVNNCSDTKSITVNVYEEVEAYAGEDMYICSDETVTLFASGGDEYLWNTGETTPSIQVSPNVDTEYSVLVFNALDADEASVMVYVDDCVSQVNPPIENNDQEFDFLIYQDVSLDVLKVQISGLNNVDVDQLTIYDLTGKTVYNEVIIEEEDQMSYDKTINSSPFARGIYVVKLIYDDTQVIKKIPIR